MCHLSTRVTRADCDHCVTFWCRSPSPQVSDFAPVKLNRSTIAGHRWIGRAPTTVASMHLLFVCTGSNMCRSLIGERLTCAYAVERGLPRTDLSASSAGTRAVLGSRMDPHAAVVLAGLGGDATGFRGRSLTAEQAAEADLVLTMTSKHRTSVLNVAPRALAKTFTLA